MYVDWDTVLLTLATPESYAPYCSEAPLRARIMKDLLQAAPKPETPDRLHRPSVSPLSNSSSSVTSIRRPGLSRSPFPAGNSSAESSDHDTEPDYGVVILAKDFKPEDLYDIAEQDFEP